MTSVELASVARSPGGYTQRYEKRCGRSAATTVMPTTWGVSESARNVSEPIAPAHASTSATSLNHVRISSGSVIVRHTTSIGASISMSRSIVDRSSAQSRTKVGFRAVRRRLVQRSTPEPDHGWIGGFVGIKPAGREARSAADAGLEELVQARHEVAPAGRHWSKHSTAGLSPTWRNSIVQVPSSSCSTENDGFVPRVPVGHDRTIRHRPGHVVRSGSVLDREEDEGCAVADEEPHLVAVALGPRTYASRHTREVREPLV